MDKKLTKEELEEVLFWILDRLTKYKVPEGTKSLIMDKVIYLKKRITALEGEKERDKDLADEHADNLMFLLDSKRALLKEKDGEIFSLRIERGAFEKANIALKQKIEDTEKDRDAYSISALEHQKKVEELEKITVEEARKAGKALADEAYRPQLKQVTDGNVTLIKENKDLQATIGRIREAAKPFIENAERHGSENIIISDSAPVIMDLPLGAIRELKQACTEEEPVPQFDRCTCPTLDSGGDCEYCQEQEYYIEGELMDDGLASEGGPLSAGEIETLQNPPCPDCGGSKRIKGKTTYGNWTEFDCPTCKDGIREVVNSKDD